MIDIGNGVRVNIGDLGDNEPCWLQTEEFYMRMVLKGSRPSIQVILCLIPVLLSVINHAPRDFWAPVDPSMIRDPTGGGVKDEEWEKMRVFTFVKDVEGVQDANQQKTTVLDIEKSSQLPPLPPNTNLPPIQSFDGCVICFCEFETGDVVRELQCRHAFHDECISKWMKGRKEGGQGKRTCPLCVSEVHV
ncbi:hypothetical protein BDR26DRAFT_522368 [Obelidium mucronatum]|nr:hypothetical protein BDR26DRAFT_522368 [Obelidium mucronatum]